MNMLGEKEMLARALVAQVLRASDWTERLDGICRNMHAAAMVPHPQMTHPVETMQAVAVRAEEILRHIAVADALTIGCQYFDLLPRNGENPLTAAVINALSDGHALLRLLKDSGTRLQVRKDEAGVDYITVHDMDDATGLGEGFKAAVMRALDMTSRLGRPPQGALHSVH